MSQIITVTFAEGQREAIAAQPLEQWAYGQTLQFEGLDLPEAYQVDFSNFEFCGASIPRVGGADGVAVPVEVLTSGRNVYAFIWVQDETSGARYYRATVRVVPGPAPDPDESPEEQSAVTDAINALNAAAEAIPEQVNAAVEEAVSSGTFADVFWITQNVTTADEIYAANLAGKVCLMKPAPGVLYYLTWCGEVQNLGPSGVVLEKQAILTAWDGDEKTTIRVLHETWLSPNTVKFARTASPTFTGAPKAPTAEAGTNSTQIATTAFVNAAIQAALEGFTPGQTISEELKQALLQLARKVAYIDDQGETYYQDLYDALYPPAVLASIQAAFAQGSTVIYNTDSLDVLKPLLTVTAVYDDGSTETVPAADYTLSGTLATGISTITASYQSKTATFEVVVTAAPMAFPVTNNLTGCSTSNSAAAVMENEPYSAVITPAAGYTLIGASVVITMAGSNITASAYSNGVINIARVTGALVISIVAQQIVLSSISASYTQSGVVYNTDTLDSLKADLVVTAAYSDGTSTVLAADAYTLSGTLTAGTSTITVSYGGKSTTFQVTVTAAPQVYLVTNNLAGCSTSNSAASVVEGSAYAAQITASTGYTLVGAVVTITMGGQDITASAYSGGVISIPAVTGALVISVAAVAVVLSSITAVYTQSGTVYDTDTLDSLKADLVVTAHYSDSSTQTVRAADYTLSGTLTVGTSTITVSYGGKTTTFNVTVEYGIPDGYTKKDYVCVKTGGVSSAAISTWIILKQYDNLNALSTEFAVKPVTGHGDGIAVFGRRVSGTTGAASSYAIYCKIAKASWQLHGSAPSSDDYRPDLVEDAVNIIYYQNTSASPSSIRSNDNSPISVSWTNDNVLNIAPMLFSNPNNDTTADLGGLIQCGYIKFFDLNGNLVSHYIPVVRTSDNRIGMYDVVEKEFYTPQNATVATVGASGYYYEVGNWS